MIFSRKKTIVTHSGSFHADDIFACATLAWYLETKGKKYRIVRTRDQEEIAKGNYVIDVGCIYDPEHERYDHHQQGGAGERDNGIPYASFGLVWKHYGPLLCNDEGIVSDIDRRLVQPIDAIDNGISITQANEHGLYDYGIHGIISAFQVSWKEADADAIQYDNFRTLVSFFKEILMREYLQAQHRIEMVNIITQCYKDSIEKEIIEIPHHVNIGPLMQALGDYPEVKYVVAKSNNHWKALSLREDTSGFENRILFPNAWAGKRGEELQKVTGVNDAVFCHNARFLAVAKTKEGAHKLAQLSLLHSKRAQADK
jgi:uncharacterized UPF0160 family protein